MSFRLVAPLVAAFVCAAPAANAAIAEMTDAQVGQSFTVQFDGNVNSTPIADLNSKAVFTLSSITNSGATWTFNVDVEMLATGGISARMSGLGFDVTPDVISASATGLFDAAVLGGAYPNGYGSIEVCFKEGPGASCQGGGGGGTFTTGSFTAVLNFANPTTQIAFDKFGVRYQSITGLEVCGNSTECTSGTGNGTSIVPAPATWSLMILAFGILGAAARRRWAAIA